VRRTLYPLLSYRLFPAVPNIIATHRGSDPNFVPHNALRHSFGTDEVALLGPRRPDSAVPCRAERIGRESGRRRGPAEEADSGRPRRLGDARGGFVVDDREARRVADAQE